MRIREGDPLEIFVSNEGEVIFKKYPPYQRAGQHRGAVLRGAVSHRRFSGADH